MTLLTRWYKINFTHSMHKYNYAFEYAVDDVVYPYTDIPWFLEQMRKISVALINYLITSNIDPKEFLKTHTGLDTIIMGISAWYIIAAENETSLKDTIYIKVADPIKYKYYVDALYSPKPSLPPLPDTNDVLEFIQKG